MGQSAYDISIRESLQKNRKLGFTVAAILILATLIIAARYLWPNTASNDSLSAFFTDDDGQTYFKDSIFKLPPFDHNGREADLAIVCTNGKNNYVACLERFTPEARKKLQDVYDANPDATFKVLDLMASPEINLNGMEFKDPGGSNSWTARSAVL